MHEVKQDRLLEIRHSFSHVMAEAVLQVFPDAKLAIGPAIDDGFYYDFDLPRALTHGGPGGAWRRRCAPSWPATTPSSAPR